jgi:type II secretory pathway component PulJ
MRTKAFTLIEMLLAAAGAAIILAVLVSVYGRAVHLRNTSAEHTRASRVEARAISVIRNDLRNAWLSGGKMAVTLDTGDSSSHSQFPGDLRFNTTTGRINEDTFAPELQQVEYYIGQDPDSPDQKSGALKRAVNRTLLGTLDQPDAEETILSGVESMDVGFFDGSQWQTTWDTSSSGTGSSSSSSSSTSSTTSSGPAIPLAIRVRLALAPDARPGTTRRIIEVLVPWTTQANPAPPNLPANTDADDGSSSPSSGKSTGAGTGTGAGASTGGGAK